MAFPLARRNITTVESPMAHSKHNRLSTSVRIINRHLSEMENANMKKAVALLLSLVMLLSLAACGGTKTVEQVTDTSTTPTVASGTLSDGVSNDRMFTEKKLDLGVDVDAARSVFANGRIYYRTDTDVKNDDDEIVGTITEILSVNSDGGDVKTHLSRELLIVRDTETDTESYEYLQIFGVDSKGNIWVVVQTTTYKTGTTNRADYTSENKLTKLSPNGEELLSVDISAVDGVSWQYITGMINDGAGNVYVSCYSEASSLILVFSGETGEYMFRSEGEGLIQCVVTNDGRIVYMTGSTEGQRLTTLDATVGGVASSVVYDATAAIRGIFDGLGEWNVLIFRNNRIYGLNLETMGSAVIIDFETSGIDASMLTRIHRISDDEFVVLKQPATGGSAELFKLTYDPDAAAIEKVTVTLGVVAADAMVAAMAVDEFNKTSENVRVEIVDYATLYNTESDRTQAVTRFDIDVLGGNAPDMLSFSGFSPNKYISKGVLADLTGYLENDKNINREHLYEHILDMGRSGGNLFHIITGFHTFALVGKTSVFGDTKDFTLAKLNEIAARYPTAEIVCEFTAMEWLDTSVRAVMKDLIDWETGICSFDNADFTESLKLLKRLPNVSFTDIYHGDYTDIEYYEDYRDKLQNDRTLLVYAPMSYTYAIRDIEADFGEEVTMLGFPSASGGGTVVVPSFDFGIMESSGKKEAAWEFISWLLQDGNLARISTSITPTNRHDYEERLYTEMIPLVERNFSQTVLFEKYTGRRMNSVMYTITGGASIPDELIEMYGDYPLSQRDVDRVLESIYSVKYPHSGEAHVMKIVTEEAEAFLNGVRSAEETAKLIQSRVSIYVSENM